MNKEIDLLIVDFLTGSLNEEDLSRLKDWIKQSPQNKQHFNSVRNAWLLAGYSREHSCEGDPILRLKNITPVNNHLHLNKYIRLAASWIIFLALGSLLTILFSGKHKNVQTAQAAGRIEIHSPLGSRSRIMMPDSTMIWLNAGTTISYDQDYGIASRTVDLEGEAYFDVMKDDNHTFIVRTKDVDIMALGTRFNVKAYSEEETITATLEEGKINIKLPGPGGEEENILLKPNDSFVYRKETKGNTGSGPDDEKVIRPEKLSSLDPESIDIFSNVRTELYTSWKDQRWIIDREPFNTLLPKLERRYNMKFILQDQQIREFKFTGTVENESIDQLLNAVRWAAPVEYSIVKDTVRLYLDTAANEKFKEALSGKN